MCRREYVAWAHCLIRGVIFLPARDWRCCFHLERRIEPVVRYVQPQVEIERGTAGFGVTDESFRARHDVDGGVECAAVCLAQVIGIKRARRINAICGWERCASVGALVGVTRTQVPRVLHRWTS